MGLLSTLRRTVSGWRRKGEPVTLDVTPLPSLDGVEPFDFTPAAVRGHIRVHPRNVPGEFCVEAECCTLCGVPWHVAPDLFDYDDSGCWVKRQPVTDDERARMLRVLDAQELGCIQRRSPGAPIAP